MGVPPSLESTPYASPPAPVRSPGSQSSAHARPHRHSPLDPHSSVLRSLLHPLIPRICPHAPLLYRGEAAALRVISCAFAGVSRYPVNHPPSRHPPQCAPSSPKCHSFPFFVWCISGSRCFVLVLRRRRCCDERRVHNRPLSKLQPLRCKMSVRSPRTSSIPSACLSSRWRNVPGSSSRPAVLLRASSPRTA